MKIGNGIAVGSVAAAIAAVAIFAPSSFQTIADGVGSIIGAVGFLLLLCIL